MYKALLSGATYGKSGAYYRYDAGQTIKVEKGELDHDNSFIWIEIEDKTEEKPKRKPRK
jgi:hypothetical protein